jgi:hypothetical protein
MRERWQARNPNKPKFPTGHFHVAWVQAYFDIITINGEKKVKLKNVNLEDNYRIAIFDSIGKLLVGENSQRSIYNELSNLIKTVENSITNTLTNFNDLF